MKKILYIILTFLEILLFAGAYAVYYFTRKKMGMARYVLYKNQMLEKAMPVRALLMAAAVILLILAVIAIAKIMKKDKKRVVLLAEDIILTLGITGYTFIRSPESSRPYYFLCTLMLAAGLIQIVKSLLVTGRRQKTEEAS